MQPGNAPSHFHNPLLAAIDIASVAGLLGYWTDVLQHTVALLSTSLSGAWFAYCLVSAIKSKKRG